MSVVKRTPLSCIALVQGFLRLSLKNSLSKWARGKTDYERPCIFQHREHAQRARRSPVHKIFQVTCTNFHYRLQALIVLHYSNFHPAFFPTFIFGCQKVQPRKPEAN